MSFSIQYGNLMAHGTDSEIYSLSYFQDYNPDRLVAKRSKQKDNYMSFNLQKEAMIILEKDLEHLCESPKFIYYDRKQDFGDLLVMTKIPFYIPLEEYIELAPSETTNVIKIVARLIATLHNKGNSGYGIELYWDYVNKKLVLLDISSMDTFGFSTEEMLYKHWMAEKDNYMGRWNLISQIVPIEEAKKVYKNKSALDYSFSNMENYINNESSLLHVINVAKVHALYIIGKIKEDREFYAKLFVSEYIKQIKTVTFYNDTYINNFLNTILENVCNAKAKIYYSTVSTLCDTTYECDLSYINISWIRDSENNIWK